MESLKRFHTAFCKFWSQTLFTTKILQSCFEKICFNCQVRSNQVHFRYSEMTQDNFLRYPVKETHSSQIRIQEKICKPSIVTWLSRWLYVLILSWYGSVSRNLARFLAVFLTSNQQNRRLLFHVCICCLHIFSRVADLQWLCLAWNLRQRYKGNVFPMSMAVLIELKDSAMLHTRHPKRVYEICQPSRLKHFQPDHMTPEGHNR